MNGGPTFERAYNPLLEVQLGPQSKRPAATLRCLCLGPCLLSCYYLTDTQKKPPRNDMATLRRPSSRTAKGKYLLDGNKTLDTALNKCKS